MEGDGNLAPMSEERGICMYVCMYVYEFLRGGALLTRTAKDIPKIFVGGDTASVLVCRKLCEKILGGHDHVTLVT